MGTLGLMCISMSPTLAAPTFPAGPICQAPGLYRGWRSGDHAGASQGSSLFRREQPLDAWPQLVEFYGFHGSAGAAAMALRRLGRP